MAKYFVSRHQGAKDWALRHGIDAQMVEHFDVSIVEQGDEVFGSLPVHSVAIVCQRGGRFFHLSIPISKDKRGDELSADDLDNLGAALEEYYVRRV